MSTAKGPFFKGYALFRQSGTFSGNTFTLKSAYIAFVFVWHCYSSSSERMAILVEYFDKNFLSKSGGIAK